jgi:hypothetical protein
MREREEESNLEFVGTSRDVPGEASSGFAMRKPPKDCERLKSSSMVTPESVAVALKTPSP